MNMELSHQLKFIHLSVLHEFYILFHLSFLENEILHEM